MALECAPTKRGTQELWLIVSVLHRDNDRPIDATVFERHIDVAANPGYTLKTWLASNWDRLLATLGISGVGVASAVYAWFRRYRSGPHRASRRQARTLHQAGAVARRKTRGSQPKSVRKPRPQSEARARLGATQNVFENACR
jgi:hypothetical protein